jgi:hypothetical protein
VLDKTIMTKLVSFVVDMDIERSKFGLRIAEGKGRIIELVIMRGRKHRSRAGKWRHLTFLVLRITAIKPEGANLN